MTDWLRATRAVWKILIGGGLTAFAGSRLVPLLNQTQITVESLVWIAVVAVGISVLGSAFD